MWAIDVVEQDGTRWRMPDPHVYDDEDDANGFVSAWNSGYPPEEGYCEFVVVPVTPVRDAGGPQIAVQGRGDE